MKHCLILDDQNQKTEIELLESKSAEQGFPIKCHFLNLSDRAFSREEIINGQPDFVIDFDKVIDYLRQTFKGQQIDLIACDYKYTDETTDGLKLVQFLKEQKFRGKGLPFILYSSKFEEIEEKLQFSIKELIENKDQLKIYLESYFDTKPEKIIDRTNYDDTVIEYLKKNKTPLSIKLESKLLDYPDNVFKNIFPRFEGKTLRQLAILLNKSGPESDDFESEFLERSIAHFIYLEE